MYLFVFAVLLAVVFYVNGSKVLESKEKEIKSLREQLEEQEANIGYMTANPLQDDTFSLASNEEALSYLESRGFDTSEVMSTVEEELISKNLANADNVFIPYEGMEGPFRINKVKLLNHKWAIASFTDGTYWGELFLSYELNEAGNVELNTEKAVLYPRN